MTFENIVSKKDITVIQGLIMRSSFDALFVAVLVYLTMYVNTEETMDIAANVTIGVIVDSQNASSGISVSGLEYDVISSDEFGVKVLWSQVNTREVYTVYKTVQQFDRHTDVDLIIILDYDHHVLGMHDLLEPKHKEIVRLGRKMKPIKYVEKSLDSCGYEVKPQKQVAKPYCILDTNASREYFTSCETPAVAGVEGLLQLVLETLHWNTVTIIHENETNDEARELIDRLSVQRVLMIQYNVDTMPDLHDALSQIYEKSVLFNPELNFIVICRSNCVKRVLSTANRFDRVNPIRKTLLNQFSRWLVAVEGHTRDLSRTLRVCANDLDNVVLIALPDIYGPSKKELVNILKKVTSARLGYSDNVTNSTITKEDIIQEIVQKTRTWNPVSRCQAFIIDTLLWTEDGRGFSSVGHIDSKGHAELQSDLFPNIGHGYNMRKFTVATLEWFPFVIRHEEPINDVTNTTNVTMDTDNKGVWYDGFTMDLLKELSRVLNFTYDLVEPADQSWGGLVIEENHTFNGLIGQVQRGECDMVAAPISIQPERDVVVDFSYPYYFEYTTVLVKKPDQQSTKWRTLIDPFHWIVLLVIGISLGAVTVLMYVLEKYNPFNDTPAQREIIKRKGGIHTFADSFWYMFGALLSQGSLYQPGSTAGRTFVSCWWLTCIVVVGIYSGNLIAFLTVTKEKPPFNTLTEMVETKGYVWGTLGSTSWTIAFFSSKLPAFRKVADGLREFKETDPGVVSGRLNYHLDRVRRGGYAWIGDKTAIEIATSNECSLMQIKDEFLPLNYALVFPERSPHKMVFSEKIIKLHESGLFQIWKRKWWPKSNFCAGDNIPEAKPISLIDVQSAFYACAFGLSIGIVAFIVENIVYAVRKCKNKKQFVARCKSSSTCETDASPE